MTCRSTSGCNNNAYKELDYCVLHCSEKDINENEFNEYLTSFYELLRDYLYDEIEVEINRLPCADRQELDERDKDIEEYLLFINGVRPEGISARLIERLKKIEIEFKKIQFPSDDDFNYLDRESLNLLRWLGKVVFIKCSFNLGSLNLNSNFYYENCVFHNKLLIKPFPQVESKDYRYISCRFERSVSIEPSRNSNEIFCNLFKDCNFEEDVNLKNIDIKGQLFQLSDPLNSASINNIKEHFNKVKNNFKFKEINIEKCIFESSFKLNGFDEKYLSGLELYGCEFDEGWLNISRLEIIDTEFNSKFELKNRVIKNLKFSNSNVEGIFDAFESKIEKAYFYKSIFEDFAGFEKVHFGIKNNYSKDYIAKFIYTTFMSFSNFRETVFNSGLDLERVNLKENPNFLKVDVSQKNTNRESFRIIKHSFDSIGNQIEANKFFVKEMIAYKKELDNKKAKNNSLIEQLKKSEKKEELKEFKKSRKFKDSKRARLVFNINYCISEFGENYFKPIRLLIYSLLIYTLFNYAHNLYFKKFEYLIHPWFDCVAIFFNDLANNFLPFRGFFKDKSGMEFVSLLFYIWFAILVWQIIVAIKRHTQR